MGLEDLMATYNRYDDDKVNYLLVITKKICGPFAEIYIFTSPAIKHSAQKKVWSIRRIQGTATADRPGV